MRDESLLRQTLQETKILRPPKHTLATFGTTTLRYVMVSTVPDRPDCCRLREGDVTAQRPNILTQDFWKKRFEGFGDDQEDYRRHIERFYGDALRGLEYTFRNDLRSTSLENTPLPAMVDRVSQTMAAEDVARKALLQGPDDAWALSIMKFTIDMSLRSFPGNVRELEERGLFDPAEREEQQHRRTIERLFQDARQDSSRIQLLADRLKRSGLFAEYEDRFFGLFSGR